MRMTSFFGPQRPRVLHDQAINPVGSGCRGGVHRPAPSSTSKSQFHLNLSFNLWLFVLHLEFALAHRRQCNWNWTEQYNNNENQRVISGLHRAERHSCQTWEAWIFMQFHAGRVVGENHRKIYARVDWRHNVVCARRHRRLFDWGCRYDPHSNKLLKCAAQLMRFSRCRFFQHRLLSLFHKHVYNCWLAKNSNISTEYLNSEFMNASTFFYYPEAVVLFAAPCILFICMFRFFPNTNNSSASVCRHAPPNDHF